MDQPTGSGPDEATGAFDSWLRPFDGVPAAPAPATIKVNHDNVLGAAKIIQTQVDALSDTLGDRSIDLWIEPPGTDRVSMEAAAAWNYRLVDADDSYANRVALYVDSLRTLVAQLLDSAKHYGFTEEDITASFGGLREVGLRDA